MKILVTGFEPFLDNLVNPSAKVLELIKDKYETLLLPVSYKRAPLILNRRLKEYQPDMILSLGLASSRTKISLELIGINYEGGKARDNDNVFITGEKILPQGPDAIMTEFSVNDFVNILNEQEIPTYLSLSAGSYICNLIYYYCLNYTKKSLFIHLPDLNLSSLLQDLKAINIVLKKMESKI